MLKRIFISTLTLGVFFSSESIAQVNEKEGSPKRILLWDGTKPGNSQRANLHALSNEHARRALMRNAVRKALGNPGSLDPFKKGFSGLIVKNSDLTTPGPPNQDPPKFNIGRKGMTIADRTQGRNWVGNSCNNAFVLKLNWHRLSTDSVPTSFGKIISANITVEYTDSTSAVTTDPNAAVGGRANGSFELCSWIGENEYHILVVLTNAELIKKNTSGNFVPAGGTDPDDALLPGFEIPAKWNWKLNATKKLTLSPSIDQFDVLTATENGVDIVSDFNDIDNECIDIFFADIPPNQINTSWINAPNNNPTSDFQFGYCMGRCDARIINSD